MGFMKANLDFVVGSEYFEWTDEWWKNYTDPAYVQYTDAEVANVNLSGGLVKVAADAPFKPDNNPASWKKWIVKNPQGQVRAVDGSFRYPTFGFRLEASEDPDWPEEMWGLNAITPTNRDPEKPQDGQRFPGFDQYGYMYTHIQDPCGGSCFSQSGPSRLREGLHVVWAATHFGFQFFSYRFPY